MKLFVYGSLKKGFYNHERFGFDKLPFLGEKSLKGFDLFSLGAYPGMVPGELESVVKGEVYEISETSKDFIYLDKVERGAEFRLHRTSDYVTGEKDLYAYFYQGEFLGPKIEDGEWKELGAH